MYDMLQLNMEIGMKTSHFNGNFVKKVCRFCTLREGTRGTKAPSISLPKNFKHPIYQSDSLVLFLVRKISAKDKV